MKDGHVTIYDVAARAGVHASTASRALAGQKVRKANREAVEKAAAELGYLPNEAARSLRVTRTMTVGMVFNQLTSALGVELLSSVTATLEKAGYSLFVSTALGSAERYDELLRRFLERRVDALLCVHGHGAGAALERFERTGVPALALISHSGGFSRLPLVSPSVRDAAEDCLRDLRALGHHAIAVVEARRPIHLTQDFIDAGGGQVTRLEAPRHDSGAIDAAGFLAQWRTLTPRPTAVAALQADAAAILEVAEGQGLTIPGDLSVVAIRDRSMQRQPTRIPLSLIHIDPTRAGSRVGEILIDWLETKTPWTQDLKVAAGEWRPGATTGPA